jgi:hypothetical protein
MSARLRAISQIGPYIVDSDKCYQRLCQADCPGCLSDDSPEKIIGGVIDGVY